MPRQKNGAFDNKAYQNQYHKAMKTKLLSFNTANQNDMEIWDHLQTMKNQTGYIKGLIRTDMERRKNMTYKIKPEFLDLWGEDAYEQTILTEEEVENICRGWSTPVWNVQNQLIPDNGKYRYWFAVQRDHEDSDWGYGSYNFDEARKMAIESGAKLIAVIDESNSDPFCVDEITDF